MNTPEYISMLRRLTAEQITELVSAIGRDCAKRDTSRQDYADIAGVFMAIAVRLHECGGCHVLTQIQHPSWDHVLVYTTEEGLQQVPLDMDDDDDSEEFLGDYLDER